LRRREETPHKAEGEWNERFRETLKEEPSNSSTEEERERDPSYIIGEGGAK